MSSRQPAAQGQQSANLMAIDAVCNLRTPELVEKRQHQWILYDRQFGKEEPVLTVDELVQKMDASGIGKAFLIAAKLGSKYQGFTDSVPYEEVSDAIQQYPNRFYGLAGIDPLGRVHTKRSTSKMSANEMNPRKITSSFSKREKMRRNPFNRRNSLSISLRLLYISRSYSHDEPWC